MIERRSWEAMLPLRQFKGISEEVVKRLEKKDINWNTYYSFTSNQLGEMLKSSKLGKFFNFANSTSFALFPI